MNILAIESSCDETAAAVLTDGQTIVSNVVASSHDMHEKYGGIVPEVAARIQLESIIPVITEALSPLRKSSEHIHDTIRREIDAVAVTIGPGLIGSLLVGVETAKTIAVLTGKPIIPVNHVLAHMYANFVDPVVANDSKATPTGLLRPENFGIRDDMFPAISLVVSGGHTELYLMKDKRDLTWLGGTIDDAAGECFDKTARLLGFGHGGGLAIQQAASRMKSKGNIRLPRPMLNKENAMNFSFSGLKTAILREVNKLKESHEYSEETIHQLSHEVQETITDVLVKKTVAAADRYGARSVLLSGGVSANTRLRKKFEGAVGNDYALRYPPVELCTDNAVYIGAYAYFRGVKKDWKSINAYPDLPVEVSS